MRPGSECYSYELSVTLSLMCQDRKQESAGMAALIGIRDIVIYSENESPAVRQSTR